MESAFLHGKQATTINEAGERSGVHRLHLCPYHCSLNHIDVLCLYVWGFVVSMCTSISHMGARFGLASVSQPITLYIIMEYLRVNERI